MLAKFKKLWDKTKYLIETIGGDKMINTINILWKLILNQMIMSLNKILKLHMLIVIIRSAFKEDAKYYSQVFVYLYEL